MIEKQLKEAEKLGFKKCIIPENNKKLLKENLKLDIIGVKNIKDAMKEVRTFIKLIEKSLLKRNKRGDLTLKNEKGITLMILMITVIMMIILVSAGIKYGGTSLAEVRLQNFSYELGQIQGRVDAIYEKMSMDNNTKYTHLNEKQMGADINTSAMAKATLVKVKGNNYNYDSETSSTNKELYYDGNGTDAYYRYFPKNEIENTLDIKNPKQDVIINFKTREVISVKGQTYNDKTYYRLQDIQK